MLAFRATPGEEAQIAGAAEQDGLSPAGYIRACAVRAATTRSHRRPTLDQEAAAKFLKELHRAGANMYQITRRVNFGEGVALGEIRAALTECREAIAACHAVLGTRR